MNEVKNPFVSIVIPMHNEEPVIGSFFETLYPIMRELNLSFELLCVNDGSTDQTLLSLLNHQQTHAEIKVVNLSRNFGKEAALVAGLRHAVGDVVIPIDADLQDPPDVIFDLLAKWREGYEQVVVIRKDRGSDSLLKRWSAQAFYKVFNSLTDRPMPANAGDFRLLDRKVVDVILQLDEKNLFMKGIFNWLGFKTAHVECVRAERHAGTSSWSFLKLWRFALDGIFSFSSVPLKVWSYIGFFISICAVMYMFFVIIKTLVFGIDVPGYASLMVVVLFIGGIQLISLGVIAEYISRIYKEAKNRPLYVVDKVYDSSKKALREQLSDEEHIS